MRSGFIRSIRRLSTSSTGTSLTAEITLAIATVI